MVSATLQGMDTWFSAYRWLLKYSQLYMMQNLVSPMHSHLGRSFARNDNDAEDRGYGKKRMAACNRLHRGTTFIQKDADFPLVSHCMNRDKPMNMRKSITPNGEILIDTKCYWAVSWNYKRDA